VEQTVAQVYVEKAVYAIDRPYSYAVLGEMRDTLCRGCRVLVPFGGGNRRVQGMVSAVETREVEESRPLKPVLAQLDKTPLLTDEMFGMIGYLTAHTYCTCYEAVKAVLPNGMNVSVSERFVQSRRYTDEECAALSEPEERVLRFLQTEKTEKELRAFLNIRQHAAKFPPVRALLSAGMIRREEEIGRAHV